jgi:hypothetical protein
VRPSSMSEGKFMELRRRSRDEIPWSRGVVGVRSGGIELVLKQISLPVAQIRVICENGPQVSIDDIKCYPPHEIRIQISSHGLSCISPCIMALTPY